MRTLPVASISLALIVALGCRSEVEHAINPKPGVEAETALTHAPQFNDIPIPQGYELQKDRLEGYAAEQGQWRAGRLNYRGVGRPLDAVTYFEQRMPQHGWVLTDRGTAADTAFLVYRKGDSTARIEVASERPYSDTAIRIRVTTSFATEAAAIQAR